MKPIIIQVSLIDANSEKVASCMCIEIINIEERADLVVKMIIFCTLIVETLY